MRRWKAILWSGFAAALVAGCASKEAPGLRPGAGIAEFREITELSEQAVQSALAALDVVGGQSSQCSPDAIAGLSDQVRRLQVDSVQVRARSQVILARGDAYFENWHETLLRVDDPEVRALVEARHPELRASFEKIKGLAGQSRAAFQPFLSGLRDLRNSLETDPASLRSGANQELLANTRHRAKDVLLGLSGIRAELEAMKALLTPARQ